MNRSIRTAALAALLAAAGAAAAQAPRGDVVLYEHSEFRGRALALGDDAPDFERFGFNDRASSIRIERGTWEFCFDARYRGNCETLGPGSYASLGGFNDRISSARRIAGGGPRGGRSRDRDSDRRRPRADVELYDAQDFAGYLGSLEAAAPNFEGLGFNDRVASIIVHRGRWQFCTDANYRGTCHVFGPGEYRAITARNRYSSARPAAPSGGPPSGPPGKGGGPAPGRARIVLYNGADFAGRSLVLDATAPNLEPLGFNDRAQSAIVQGGTWRLCSDAHQRGHCRDFPPGRYPLLPPDLRSKLSSARLR